MERAGGRVAVVGHVEWVRFARVHSMPRAGEVTHAQAPFEEPAGGGAVAAVQLARLAGSAELFTALGDDEHGRRSIARLGQLGVRVHAALRPAPTRTAVTLVDDAGERTIVTFGERLDPVARDRALPWHELSRMDAVYFTAGDVGALRAARESAVLVATPRAADALGHGVALDALVLSEDDAIEQRLADRSAGDAKLVVCTQGAHGGFYRARDGREGEWEPAPLPGDAVDSYGCGDSFAAGLTYGLGAERTLPDALALAARCGAACLTGRGPYERQLTCEAARCEPRT
jgi:ribokinase